MSNVACEIESSRAAEGGRALYALAGLAVRPFAALAGYYRHRATLAQLAELDDRMLSDIGLNRFDVHDALALRPQEDVSRFLRGRAAERRRARPARG